jgi:hypothetical protein
MPQNEVSPAVARNVLWGRGVDQLAHPLAARAQQHNQESNSTPTFKVAHLGMACPECEKQGRMEAPLFQNPADRKIYCLNNHTWRDTEELQLSRPHQLVNYKPPQAKQIGHVDLPVQIPGHLHPLLEKRFGDRLNATLGAVLQALTEENSFIVSSDDSKQMSEWLGTKIKSGQQVRGIILDLVKDRAQLQERVDRMVQQKALGQPVRTDDEFVIHLSADHRKAIEDKAAFNGGETAEQYLEKRVAEAITNNWY